MKKYFVFLVLSLSFINANAGSAGRGSALYTPQEAIADSLSETLKFVGRGVPDPVRDENDEIIPGGSEYCVFKNSKVYVVHQACGADPSEEVPVMSMEVYRRTGGSVQFYAEPNSSNYSLESLGAGFRGSWKITAARTPMINGDLKLQDFFEYFNSQNRNLLNIGSCVYGKTGPGLNGNVERMVCAGMPEQSTWRDAASSVYSAPADAQFNEFHDAVRLHSR